METPYFTILAILIKEENPIFKNKLLRITEDVEFHGIFIGAEGGVPFEASLNYCTTHNLVGQSRGWDGEKQDVLLTLTDKGKNVYSNEVKRLNALQVERDLQEQVLSSTIQSNQTSRAATKLTFRYNRIQVRQANLTFLVASISAIAIIVQSYTGCHSATSADLTGLNTTMQSQERQLECIAQTLKDSLAVKRKVEIDTIYVKALKK
jgi:hypothetical protein